MPGTLSTSELVDLLSATGLDRSSWVLRLFVNDFQPDAFSTIADFVEASFGGYSPITLNGWGPVLLAGTDMAMVQEQSRQFMAGTAPFDQVVYGYYLTKPTNYYVGAERHSGPGVPMNAAGATYSVQVKVSMKNAWAPPDNARRIGVGLSLPTRPKPPEGED